MNRVLELPYNGNPRNRINGISVGDGSQFGGIAEGERMGRIFGYVAERIIETQEEADEAASAIRRLGGQIERIAEYPIGGAIHRVVIVRKIAPTPKSYPRPFAKIKKAPL